MKNKQSLFVTLIIGFILLLVFGSSMFHGIKPGERAIVFKTISGFLDKDNVVGTGLKIIAPWNDLYRYDVTEQIIEETMDMLDKKGLSITIDITVRFVPVDSRIGYLHEKFKGNYINNLVKPEVRSAARKILGQYGAEEIFSSKRSEVETSMKSEISKILIQNNVEMKAMLIRSIRLPAKIRDAIDSKEEQRQVAEAMQYKLQKEEQEADRKRIEARGIADFNKIISASLTSNILKQKGIDATLKLAESANAKVVVIGSGKDGLPLILGNN